METNLAEITPISEVMTKGAICVSADLSVEAVTALLLEHGISGAPVVDERGHAVGVISKTDLLRVTSQQVIGHDSNDLTPPLPRSESGPSSRARESSTPIARSPSRPPSRPGRTVGEIMTPVAFTMKETAPIAQAAAMMAFEAIHRLPIVSDAGEVIGILSSIDVLRWIAEQEGYLVTPKERPGHGVMANVQDSKIPH